MKPVRLLLAIFPLALLLAAGLPAWAIIPGVVPPTPPTGIWSGLNLSYVYDRGGASGVAVGSNYILTVRHGAGYTAFYDAVNVYTVAQVYYAPTEVDPINNPLNLPPDLALARVTPSLPAYYNRYGGPYSFTDDLIAAGWGYNGTTGTLSGVDYYSQTGGGGLSWGSNRPTAAFPADVGGTYYNHMLEMDFSLSDGFQTPYECGVGSGDSGGAVFIETSPGNWYLTGILETRDTRQDPPLDADLNQFDTDYAIDLRYYNAWIDSIVFVPEPASGLCFMLFSVCLLRRRPRAPSRMCGV